MNELSNELIIEIIKRLPDLKSIKNFCSVNHLFYRLGNLEDMKKYIIYKFIRKIILIYIADNNNIITRLEYNILPNGARHGKCLKSSINENTIKSVESNYKDGFLDGKKIRYVLETNACIRKDINSELTYRYNDGCLMYNELSIDANHREQFNMLKRKRTNLKCSGFDIDQLNNYKIPCKKYVNVGKYPNIFQCELHS